MDLGFDVTTLGCNLWATTFPSPPCPPPSSLTLPGLTDLQRDLRRGLLGVVVPQLAPPLAVMDEVDRDAEEGGLVVKRRRLPRWDPLQP